MLVEEQETSFSNHHSNSSNNFVCDHLACLKRCLPPGEIPTCRPIFIAIYVSNTYVCLYTGMYTCMCDIQIYFLKY